MTTIDQAFNHLEQGITLEEQGERSNAPEKLNMAAIHYFEACTLMKNYITNHRFSSSQNDENTKQLLQQKIILYESRGRSLVRRIRRQPDTFLKVDGEIVQVLQPPSEFVSESQSHEETSKPKPTGSNSSGSLAASPASTLSPSLMAYNINSRPTVLHQVSLSMMPLPQAIPVSDEEIKVTQEDNQRILRKKVQEICQKAESIFEEAIEFDNDRRKTRYAINAYEEAARLFLEAAKLTGQLMSDINEKEKQQIKAYHTFLRDRVGKILDHIEQLQKEGKSTD